MKTKRKIILAGILAAAFLLMGALRPGGDCNCN